MVDGMTTFENIYRPAEVGNQVWWQIYRSSARGYGRVTAITDSKDAAWPQERLQYHVVDTEGMLRVIPAAYINRYEPQPSPETFNPLDVKPCRCCRAYLQSGLQDTVHPNHLHSCELYPDNAWRGYRLVKL
jgi:hypothetical protein